MNFDVIFLIQSSEFMKSITEFVKCIFKHTLKKINVHLPRVGKCICIDLNINKYFFPKSSIF